ncbi:alpha-hydroxy acid oxidase [Streptomyces hoynatensis]|uniref:Alpha-hydroxy-acid oxidizing protein n=1 Tax=Streptomyces hoynatensis TaxID=1141874 RepID=A0A3A9Z1V1_9ACTN|nr:alpha-hydroxy acid oxidase [Streptomyces hoynatensis]RKN41317.1 alpha-hydroxy-acid oxidizing protein [Streptomyces hoynatensis]
MLNLREFEAAARAVLDPAHADYFAGGAGDELTLRANEEAFARLRLLPRVLRGGGKQDLAVTLLGSRAALPILISPTAFHKLAHPEGELATARAAAAAGAIMIASMAATTSVGDIAAAARTGAPDGAPLWFQLYIQPDLEFTEILVRRAEEAGCEALVVTVDSPARGAHERDRRNGFTDLPDGLCCENLRDPRTGRVLPIVMSPEITWWHVDWLRRTTSLPLVLKGVLHPEDAGIALRHGVDGLLLSNHGGRQLDGVPATVELLPEIVAAVEGRIPVILDGGVRRGTDVAKALALGAAAVGVGRPVLWGLAVDGERGVGQVLELLREELDHTLTLLGVGGLPGLTPGHVRPAPAAGAVPPGAER